MVTIKRGKVAADDLFLAAAEAIDDQIKNQVNKKENFLRNTENWLSEMGNLTKMRTLGVTGSPKFDPSNVDFGWGKARRLEALSLDAVHGEKYSLMSLSNSDGGLVVGLSLPKERLEAFAAIFAHGLNS